MAISAMRNKLPYLAVNAVPIQVRHSLGHIGTSKVNRRRSELLMFKFGNNLVCSKIVTHGTVIIRRIRAAIPLPHHQLMVSTVCRSVVERRGVCRGSIAAK
jgi:hypothetical protein